MQGNADTEYRNNNVHAGKTDKDKLHALRLHKNGRTTGAGHLVVIHFGHIGNIDADDDIILRRVLLVLVGLASTVKGRGTDSNTLCMYVFEKEVEKNSE